MNNGSKESLPSLSPLHLPGSQCRGKPQTGKRSPVHKHLTVQILILSPLPKEGGRRTLHGWEREREREEMVSRGEDFRALCSGDGSPGHPSCVCKRGRLKIQRERLPVKHMGSLPWKTIQMASEFLQLLTPYFQVPSSATSPWREAALHPLQSK